MIKINIPTILTKEYVENHLLTKNKNRFNTNLFKYIDIPEQYSWCSTKAEYLNCILLGYTKQPTCINDNCQNVVKYNNQKNRKYNDFCSASCATSSPITQQKLKNTNLKKFGTEFASQNKKIKEKVKKTNKDKYGVNCSLNNKDIQKKTKKTNKDKYGTETYLNSSDFANKTKKTNKDKYGTETYLNSSDFANKTKKTNKDKYGVEESYLKNFKKYKRFE